MQEQISRGEVDEGEQLGLLLTWRFMLATLLKAQYLFANILVDVLIAEALEMEKPTLLRFLGSSDSTQGRLAPLSLSAILPTYCVVVYRHKLVAHHDFPRTHGIARDPDGTHHFDPQPHNLRVSTDDTQEVRRLQGVYEEDFPAIARELHWRESLDFLFYNIPIGSLGAVSQDRRAVNKLVERLGCKSMSREGIDRAIDQFCLAVVDAVL
jgi:hypothetical protein